MTRLARREVVDHLEVVTIFRDRLQLPYHDMVAQLDEKADLYAIYSVHGVLHDASVQGLGLSFEGQCIRAKNLLRPGEHYLLQLKLAMPSPYPELAPYLIAASSFYYLLVRAICRWERTTAGVSRVGFELVDTNPEPLLRFLTGRLRETNAIDKPEP